MVYISELQISNLLQKLGLYVKYPLDDVTKKACTQYMMSKFRRHTDYNRLARRFIGICGKYITIMIGTSAQQYPLEIHLKSFCTGKMHRFYLYHKHGLLDFKCTTFLTGFFNKSLDDIIQSCKCINAASDLTQKIKNNPVFEPIQKILHLHMIVTLAQTMHTIKLAVQKNATPILSLQQYHQFVSCNYPLREYIQKNLPIKEIINDPDSALFISMSRVFKNTDPAIDFVVPCTLQIYKNNLRLYKFFTNKSFEEIKNYCDQNPDFGALVGMHFLKKAASKNLLIFQVCVMENYILNDFILPPEQVIIERKTVEDLHLPSIQIPDNIITIEV